MNFTRRSLLQLGAAAVVGSALPSSLHAADKHIGQQSFRFAVIADTHVTDEFYVPGSENGIEDNESILHTAERLTSARDIINGVHPVDGKRVEMVFLAGDCFHNYPSGDLDFYYKHRTRVDIARSLLDGFHMPVHIGFGNHDYDAPGKSRISREMSHQLFKDKLNTEPYYGVDHQGFRFLHLNNFLGKTWDPDQSSKERQTGSFGERQLQWAEAQLAERKPTVVFVHYPLWFQQPTEFADFGLHPLLRKYQDNIRIVIAGHHHRWIDFAHTYGPQHTVMASTRYDQNAFMLFDADPRTGSLRWVDQDRPQWSTHFATPYSRG